MTDSDRPDDRCSVSGSDGVIRATYDWSSTTPSAAVVDTVAIGRDREPTAIPLLYESVDPDALDTLVGSDETHASARDATVSFSYAGQNVTVRRDGVIVVRPIEEESDTE